MIPARALLEAYSSTLKNFTAALKDTDLNAKLLAAAQILSNCLKSGGKILICGNGGSHCSALHFAEELTGRFRKDRRPLAALALGEATHASCVSNDYEMETVFSRHVEALGKPEDVLLMLSTSGQSINVYNAGSVAQRNVKMKTIGLLGRTGGLVFNVSNLPIIFPGETSDRIQELHVFALHLLVELIERDLFPENYTS